MLRLIPFTMQMCFIIIGGYVVASSPPVARIIEMLAQLPRSGRGAVAFVALDKLVPAVVSDIGVVSAARSQMDDMLDPGLLCSVHERFAQESGRQTWAIRFGIRLGSPRLVGHPNAPPANLRSWMAPDAR